MRERFIYDKDFRPIRTTPVVEVKTRTNLGVLDLDHENTTLRLFGEGFDHMNHVEYRNKQGITGIFLNQFESPGLREQLVGLGFDHSMDHVPHQEDIEWYNRAFLIKHNIVPDVPGAAAEPSPEIQEPAQESRPGVIDLAISGALTGVAVVSALGSALLNKRLI